MLFAGGMLMLSKRFDAGFARDKALFYSQVATADPAKHDNDSSLL